MSLYDELVLAGTSTLIYDVEICNAVPQGPPERGFRYCKGWGDYRGMGISVIAAYSFFNDTYHIFLRDNLPAFAELVASHVHVVGFNSKRFDDNLVRAHGYEVETTYDLLLAIQAAARKLPKAEGKRSYKLDVVAQHNLGVRKTGSGGDAPFLFQRGKLGELASYCLQDVQVTRKLLEARYALRCPHTDLPLPLERWEPL